ncbi:hypothetical protein, partial [Klebsiella pneumoniae]
SLWDALRMNMMISYQELVRTFPNTLTDHTVQRYFVGFTSRTFYCRILLGKDTKKQAIKRNTA